MNRTAQTIYFAFTAVLGLVLLGSCSSPTTTPTPMAISPTPTITPTPTPDTTAVAKATDQAARSMEKTQTAASVATSAAATSQARPPTSTPTSASDARTGVDELDLIIQIGQDGDSAALQSLIRYLTAECTFDDGLGGAPKCEEGESEGETVEVLPVLAGEGHFIRKDEIDNWIGIDGTDLYAVYSVSDSAFSSAIYPGGEHAIAFINDARFMISTLHIVDGQIVRADYTVGNPPVIRPDDVNTYLIAPGE